MNTDDFYIVEEIWTPTPQLRWRSLGFVVNMNQISEEKVLQQLYQSSKDKQEWRDVETVNTENT